MLQVRNTNIHSCMNWLSYLGIYKYKWRKLFYEYFQRLFLIDLILNIGPHHVAGWLGPVLHDSILHRSSFSRGVWSPTAMVLPFSGWYFVIDIRFLKYWTFLNEHMMKCKICSKQACFQNNFRYYGQLLYGGSFKCLESHVIMWHYHVIMRHFLSRLSSADEIWETITLELSCFLFIA